MTKVKLPCKMKIQLLGNIMIPRLKSIAYLAKFNVLLLLACAYYIYLLYCILVLLYLGFKAYIKDLVQFRHVTQLLHSVLTIIHLEDKILNKPSFGSFSLLPCIAFAFSASPTNTFHLFFSYAAFMPLLPV